MALCIIDILLNICVAVGTIGAVCVSLRIFPLKSKKVSGTYWFEKNNGHRICIHLHNKSKWFNAVFNTTQGALVITDKDSRYLTLQADNAEYFIAKNSHRILHIKTPKNAEAMRFWQNNPDKREVYIFMVNDSRIKLTYAPQQNNNKQNKQERKQ